jgi:hypothetical protein
MREESVISKVGLSLCVVAAVVLTACSGGSSMAPTGPSSASGARIAGRVTGTALASTAASGLAASPLTQSTSTTGALTVKVNGTNIATGVDGTGRFTLDGVPSGTIVLNFSGRGINADVTINGVSAGDRIDIEVRLDNGRARIEAERRDRDDDQGEDDDDDDEDEIGRDGRAEVKGLVSNLVGTCPDLRFMVGTRMVRTNSATVFDDMSCMRVQNTMRVEVMGVLAPDGMVVATRVERD